MRRASTLSEAATSDIEKYQLLTKGNNHDPIYKNSVHACFTGVMGLAAVKMNVKLPLDLSVDAEIDLCNVEDAYFLQARLNVSIPSIEKKVAQTLVDAAHQTCPYSKATRGNIDVAITLL